MILTNASFSSKDTHNGASGKTWLRVCVLTALLLAGLLLCSCALASDSGMWGELTWTLDDSGTLTISGTGKMEYFALDSQEAWRAKSSEIQNVVIGNGITNISSCSFCESAVRSITIPDSVNFIGDNAFENCKSLRSVEFPQSLEYIGNFAFCNCAALTEIIIPSVQEIQDHAFDECGNLASVQIKGGIRSIGNSAFAYCNKLAAVTLPDSLGTLMNNAFYACSSLKSVSIPNVSSIGQWAFSGSGLTSIVIPDGVEVIRMHAFSECDSLTSVSIPGSVETIGTAAFFRCYALTDVKIANGLKKIEEGAFADCSKLAEIKLPDSVNSINGSSFMNCSSLKSFVIPDGVASLEDSTFAHCISLAGVTVPDKVTSIAEYAFMDCPKLTLFVYPDSYAVDYAKEKGIPYAFIVNRPELSKVAFAKEMAEVKEEVAITAVSSTDAVELVMFTGGKEVRSWKEGYTDSDDCRTWNVSFAFSGAGKRTMVFQAIDAEQEASEPVTARITIVKSKAPTVSSVKFAQTTAAVKQDVTITAVTSTDAAKLIMYANGKEVKTWIKGYTDKDGKRTWKVTYAFGGAGDRTLDFKAASSDGVTSAAKSAGITITKAATSLNLASVKFSKATATVKQKVTITAVTTTDVTQLNMYAGKTLAQSWKKGYTDKDGKRTWKVTYAFGSAGENRKLTFKGQNAKGKETAGKSATITITKAPTISSAKFAKATAKVKEKVKITVVTSTNVTQLNMYSGKTLAKSWTTGYKDKDGKRTWTVTYSFAGAGKDRKLTFKGQDANGALTGGKDAVITITK